MLDRPDPIRFTREGWADKKDVGVFIALAPGGAETEARVTLGNILGDPQCGYLKRALRRAADDHPGRDILDLMKRELDWWQSVPRHHRPITGPERPVEVWRAVLRDHRGDEHSYPPALPWLLGTVEKVLVYDPPSSGCVGSVEVTYNARGHRALYGIRRTGELRLWAD